MAAANTAPATDTPTTPQDPAPGEPDPHAETRELLRRNGLTTAYILPDGSTCFDEKHARQYMEAEFDTLPTISAE